MRIFHLFVEPRDFPMCFELKMGKICIFKWYNGHKNGVGSFPSPVMLSTLLDLTSGLMAALNLHICGHRKLFNAFWAKINLF